MACDIGIEKKQGSDRLEPATHLHQGALRLLAYRSVTADQAQLNMNMDHFALSVQPQSNLRISVGNQNPYNINIQNGFWHLQMVPISI